MALPAMRQLGVMQFAQQVARTSSRFPSSSRRSSPLAEHLQRQ